MVNAPEERVPSVFWPEIEPHRVRFSRFLSVRARGIGSRSQPILIEDSDYEDDEDSSLLVTDAATQTGVKRLKDDVGR